MMAKRIPVLFGVALLVTIGVASPSIVLPVGFDELVARAELVFVGQVVDRRSVYLSGPDRPIVTDVTFDVLRVLKGSSGLRTKLTFLGGTVGGETLVIDGMPQFQIGERDILFVGDRTAASPLVGFWQGRYRVVRDPVTGHDLVRTNSGGVVFNGLVPSPAEVRARTAAPGRVATDIGLSLGEFEALVQSRLRAGRPR